MDFLNEGLKKAIFEKTKSCLLQKEETHRRLTLSWPFLFSLGSQGLVGRIAINVPINLRRK